jgi:hypothetical protein
VTGNDVAQAVEIRLGHEVIEDVDHHAKIANSSGGDGECRRLAESVPEGRSYSRYVRGKMGPVAAAVTEMIPNIRPGIEARPLARKAHACADLQFGSADISRRARFIPGRCIA